MRFVLAVFCAGFASVAPASVPYSAQELRVDCQHAEALLTDAKRAELSDTLAGNRCLAYLQGFVGGYEMSETLARQVGIEFVAFCLPKEKDMLHIVRAVLAYLDLAPLPPETLAAISADQMTMTALARAFACSPTDE